MSNVLKKWGPVIESFKYFNSDFDREKTAMLAEEICIFLNFDKEGKYSPIKEELKITGFLVVMLRIYVTYQISDYLGIYEYYLKFIDSLSNDSQGNRRRIS